MLAGPRSTPSVHERSRRANAWWLGILWTRGRIAVSMDVGIKAGTRPSALEHESYPRSRPGYDQLAWHPLRPRRVDSRRRAARISADFSAVGLGRARRQRDLADAARDCPCRARQGGAEG